ncbi:hypothetical protein [Caldalkalibacillus mannanilyticus]|uniref:hypothetical protein n=1 Tax=Caldalkalibacillus mannanilyticus TaxID=1418 RepID=UPI000A6D177A|nr:hypothetical protein [Caldalkalibacillus mannanilyticus]
MFNIGDTVVYTLDGTKGVVIKVDNRLCQVKWKDHFISWEKYDLLELDELA